MVMWHILTTLGSVLLILLTCFDVICGEDPSKHVRKWREIKIEACRFWKDQEEKRKAAGVIQTTATTVCAMPEVRS